MSRNAPFCPSLCRIKILTAEKSATRSKSDISMHMLQVYFSTEQRTVDQTGTH